MVSLVCGALGKMCPYGLKSMPLSFGFHRMSSPCAKNATANGGVTFMRAASFLMPSTCFIACLFFACTNVHVSFAIAAPTHANEKARCVALAITSDTTDSQVISKL